METSWEKDLKFSKKMEEQVDKKLHELYKGTIDKIERLKSKSGKVHDLDIEFAIDGIITFKSGIIQTFQEKVRREKFKPYQDFTIEYYSNEEKKVKGEFFHLSADLYLHGYSNKAENSIEEFRILDITALKFYLNKNFNEIVKKIKHNSEHSKASFIPLKFSTLEKEKNIIISKINEEIKGKGVDFDK